MLIVRAKNSFGGTENNSFLDNAYRNMITFPSTGPQPAYRVIATSQGSECGNAIFTPYAELATFQGKFFLGMIQVVRHSIKCEIAVNSLPANGESRRITKLKVWFDYRILGAIQVNVPLIDYSINSPSGLLPWDSAPGGTANVRDQAPELPNVNWAWVYFEMVVNPQLAGDFCFVPTVSALDITNASTSTALSSKYSGGLSPKNPARVANFIAQENFTGTGGSTISNESHIRFTPRNAQWLYNEMENPQGNRLNCSATCPIDFGNTIVLGPGNVCQSNTVYTVPGIGAASVNWTVDLNLITPVSGQGTNSFVVKQKLSSGFGFVRAAFTDQCSSAQQVQNTVWVGSYNSADYPVTGPTSLCEYADGYYNTKTLTAATSYQWFWPPEWTYVNGQNTPYLTVRPGNNAYTSGSVGVRVGNACGQGGSPSTMSTSIVRCGYYSIALSPNPATEELTVEIIEDDNSKKGNIEKIHVLDQNGNPIKEFTVQARKVSIDVRDLAKGTYFLKLTIENEVSTARVLIE
jgi:hypothetical protein